MASINDIIQREVNPFDPTTFKPGNFWQEKQDSALTVESIHREAIAQIESVLTQVKTDHRTRTLLLYGDSGSGKSYLLGRLKRTLNPKAFFAYIGPWPDSDFIWRHTLRQTVDSLLYPLEGQPESQLLLWLKSLSAFRERGFIQWVLGERGIFIRKLRATYLAGIYNPKEFFGVLYDLTNPELYPLACDWLRGDDLDEDDLKALGVKRAIDNEDAAQKILANFGRISAETQPIVLCFDQLDNIPRLPDGLIDLQALSSLNSTIHNENLKNFLVIISIITNTWKQNASRILPADKARIQFSIPLKQITLDQAEQLWASRLAPLHQQATPQPPDQIYPLNRQVLEQKFPAGKTYPRNALELGRQGFQRYKEGIVNSSGNSKRSQTDLATFKLIWQDKYNKVQKKITKITLLAAPELMRMLQEALSALQVQEVKPKLLTGKYGNYSLSYQQTARQERVGIVWTEDPNMLSFVNVMKACHRVVNENLCQTLYLIRAAGVGTPKLVGNQIYRQIFTDSPHSHIKPSLSSVHLLATYHHLVNATLAQELVIAGKTVGLKELETLTRKSELLHRSRLLEDLGIVSSRKNAGDNGNSQKDFQPVKEFLLNLVTTQQFMGQQTLIQNACSQFSQVNEAEIEQLLHQLRQENKIKLINPNAKPEEQSVCLVHKS